MSHRLILLVVLTTVASMAAPAQTPLDVSAMVKSIASYERGQSRQPLIAIEDLVRTSQEDPAISVALVDCLAALLQGEATQDAKLFACRQLWKLGPEAARPAISALLADDETVDMACYAIAQDPSPIAGTALRKALPAAEGRAAVAIINLLGDRKDAKAVDALVPLTESGDGQTSVAAIAALGKIGGNKAADAIMKALEDDNAACRSEAMDAALRCAEGYLADGKRGRASSLYLALAADGYPAPVRNAARLGLEKVRLGEQVRLFDGETFDGWEGNLDWFRIEDGAIVAGTFEKPIPHNEFLCTKKAFGNFELRLKVKLLGENANAGIQIRSQRVPDHHEVSGYQADMGQNYWGALYDESRRNKILAAPDKDSFAPFLRQNDWNDYVIRCEGGHVQLWMNGYKTVDYAETDDAIPRTGIIGLQIHAGKPSQAYYKDIVIREILPLE